MDRLPTVKLTAAAAVKATGDLQNFTHALNSERYVDATSNSPAYSPTHIKRQLVYMWAWEYEPFWTLTDTVAIAWSSGLHPLTGTDEVAFLYMAKGRVAGSPITPPPMIYGCWRVQKAMMLIPRISIQIEGLRRI